MAGPGDIIDLAVVGAGINGAGIACDAAGRGLSVALIEQDDLASATSGASSKLIHGGLRYLEQWQFRLVRESLQEREVLLAKAPHIVRPLRFVMPGGPKGRSAWLVRLGLFLYDHLAAHPSLPGSGPVALDPTNDSNGAGAGLRAGLGAAFEYHDCLVDDARLVVVNAMQAAALGARVLTRTRLLGAARDGALWRLRLIDLRTGMETALAARALINAAGPWARAVAEGMLSAPPRRRSRLVKGSHIVVGRVHDGDHALILQNDDGRVVFGRVHDGDHALILQNDDGRVVFVIPFEGAYSLIGTTDVAYAGDPARARPDTDEIEYLLGAVNGYLARPLGREDVQWAFAGVRPLFGEDDEDPSRITRDYAIEVDAPAGGAPALTILGGKLTTYRRLSERAVELLRPHFPAMGAAWTADAPLPGGALPGGDFGVFMEGLTADYPDLDPDTLAALARRHGALAPDVLGDAQRMAELGPRFAPGLYGREVDYMLAREWAETADDILWRRTKAGLGIDAAGRAALADYIGARKGGDRATA